MSFIKHQSPKTRRLIFLSLLSGVLIGTSYIPFPPWAIFFGFVPLIFVWRSATSYRQVFFSGWVCQATLTLIGFNWVAHTIHEFGKMPQPVAFVGLFLFASFANLYVPLSGAFWFFLKRRLRLAPQWDVPLILPLLALGESIYPMIFDWNFGYTWLWQKWPAAQVSEWIGFHGLSHFSIMSNLVFFYLARDWFVNRNLRLSPPHRYLLAAWLSVFLAMNGIGAWLKHRLPAPDQSVRVLITQANIGNAEKHLAKYQYRFMSKILERYLVLTQTKLSDTQKFYKDTNKKIDFALWPETAYQDSLVAKPPKKSLQLNLEREIARMNLPVITGGYGLRNFNQPTNSLFFFNSMGQVLDKQYDKTMLLAFGEYLPGAVWFPQLKELLPLVGDFARGFGPKVIEFEGRKIGPQICYEGLFSWFTRDLANQGADLIVNVTNDSWYGSWQEPYQHLFMTLARALEIRRPLVRSTNTGISTAILANGEILEMSPLHREWAGVLELQYVSKAPQTFFMGFGYWLSFVLLGLWMLMVFIRNQIDKS